MQKHAEMWSISNGNVLLKVPQTQCLCGFKAFLKFVGMGERNNIPKYHNTNHLCCQTKNKLQRNENKFDSHYQRRIY